jgi:hypothetical protein
MDCAWRFRALATCVAFACVGVTTRPAFAAWGPDPVTVKATTASIPQVASCSDGGFGALVVWQEESSPGVGILLVQHVLADGTVDPVWPASGVVAASYQIERTHLQAFPDDQGGLYVLWTSGYGLLSMTRVRSGGVVPAGWPAGGLPIGGIYPGSLPSAVSDGAHGLLLTWGDGAVATFLHFGPESSLDAWPVEIEPFGSADTPLWPCVAATPDGGALLACAAAHFDGSSYSGQWRIVRFLADGTRAPGWPAGGLSFGAFDLTPFFDGRVERMSAALIDICPDGRGGVFAAVATPSWNGGVSVDLEVRMRRLTQAGVDDPTWPAGGIWLSNMSYIDMGSNGDTGMRAESDGSGVAFAGVYRSGVESTDLMWLLRCQNTSCSSQGYVYRPGYEVVVGRNGYAWAADYSPQGPTFIYDQSAFLAVTLMPPPSTWSGTWYEGHDTPYEYWFGDVSIAPTGDGGSVLFWSQVNQLHGLFARRFSPTIGQVTAVPQAATTGLVLREVRFIRGEGVRARMGVPPGASATLGLYDVAGRRRAEELLLGGGGEREVTLAGTASLPAGVYFVAARTGGDRVSNRVVVLP